MVSLLALATLLAAPLSAPVSAPIGEEMHRTKLEGWQLVVEPAALEDPLFPAATAELRRQLQQIVRVVPPARTADLQKIPIWIHRKSPWTQCMAYHPSAEWLRENMLPPAMAGSIEVGNLENFLVWTHEQPWMVLHELAHGYHHLMLPGAYENEELKKNFERIVAGKSYESVLRYNGQNQRHYALTNPMEYFAESTEAYFGTNDFYPFVRAELRKFDPQTDTLMAKIWGVPKRTR